MTNQTHALDLISQYSSEESDNEEDSLKLSKASNPLPVPEAVSKLFNESKNLSSHVDDPALHDGRIRSFPHVRGNWSTFVYIPYELNQSLQSLVRQAVEIGGKEVDLKHIQSPHISLTRTVVLQYHWIDALIEDIKKSLCKVDRFPISFSSLRVYCNDEKSRTFLSLQLSDGENDLLECIKLMNSCLSAFKLPSFYEEASIHLSVAWCAGDKSKEISANLEKLNLKLQNLIIEEPNHFETIVEKVECKSGNKLFRFNLC